MALEDLRDSDVSIIFSLQSSSVTSVLNKWYSLGPGPGPGPPPLCGRRPIVITLSVCGSGPNRVCPRDFLFFHIGSWHLACRCITMRWCVTYQYCLCTTLTSDSIIDYGGVYSCPPLKFFIFSHRFMTFGMYVHFKETMCRIPILKIVHNCHTSIFPVLQVHKFHLRMTHWRDSYKMAPNSMVSSSFQILHANLYIFFLFLFFFLH
jgi:hypothetical protein